MAGNSSSSNNNNMNTIRNVNHTVESQGSVIKGIKKRISWTFSVGSDEHTVVLVWDKAFGKRQVTIGDYDYSENKMGNFFFHKWIAYDLKLHIIASAHTPAKGKVCDDFCKFDLIINGQPFSRLGHQDGTPPPKQEGPGPFGIFDIIYPQGYDVNFTKEAPFHSKEHLNQVVLKRISSQSAVRSGSGTSETATGMESSTL